MWKSSNVKSDKKRPHFEPTTFMFNSTHTIFIRVTEHAIKWTVLRCGFDLCANFIPQKWCMCSTEKTQMFITFASLSVNFTLNVNVSGHKSQITNQRFVDYGGELLNKWSSNLSLKQMNNYIICNEWMCLECQLKCMLKTCHLVCFIKPANCEFFVCVSVGCHFSTEIFSLQRHSFYIHFEN